MYSKYETKSAEDRGPDFTGRQAPAVFSPSLINLIHRDQRRTPRGYVGKLDYDPICSCQDFDGLQLTEVRIVKDAPDLAIAFVTLNFARDFPKPSYRPLKLHLIWLPQGWRIDDIETKDTPSLRKYLH